MKRKTFSLVGIGYKILAMVLSLALTSLSFVLCFYQMPWYAIIFSCTVAVFCLFATVLCFLNKIVMDFKKKQIRVYSLRIYTINLDELMSVAVEKDASIKNSKYCFIVFNFVDGRKVKKLGYTNFFQHKAVYYTWQKVNELNRCIDSLK